MGLFIIANIIVCGLIVEALVLNELSEIKHEDDKLKLKLNTLAVQRYTIN